VTNLVRPDKSDDPDDLPSRLAELEATLGEHDAALTSPKADLDAFTITYRQKVGLLYEQLDKLELKIAEAVHPDLARDEITRDRRHFV
jgi:hypothetical protein